MSDAHPILEREITITLKLKHIIAATRALAEAHRQAAVEFSFLSQKGILTTEGKIAYVFKAKVYEESGRFLEAIGKAHLSEADIKTLVSSSTSQMEKAAATLKADEERAGATVQ